MADLTLFTILLEFVPAIAIAAIYLALFGKRRNRFIEAFIILMFIKSVTFFLYAISRYPIGLTMTFDPAVDGSTFLDLIWTDFLFHVSFAVQDYFTWIMLSFVAVLFGMLVLALKLALQDPLKMKFKNLIKSIVGHEPETDGFSGFRDRVDNIRFERIESQPLDPKVVDKAWRESWKDYLIIGLATLLPSIDVYTASYANPYLYAVVVFLTWIYRFAYPASNRIAKGAGLKLGDRDIGGEMMRGVLGWFFRLNILLSLGTIGIRVIGAISAGNLGGLFSFYLNGLALAFPPIIFAILLLPVSEDFAILLYSKVFHGLADFRRNLESTDTGRLLMTVGAAVLTAGVVVAAYMGGIFAVTVNFAVSHGLGLVIFPGAVDSVVAHIMMNAVNNMMLISPTIWTLMILIIPLSMIIFLGVLGHYVQKRIEGSTEWFAAIAGSIVSAVIWWRLPGMDYTLGAAATPAELSGALWYRLRPIVVPPMDTDIIIRFAYEFVFALPLFISGTLFVMYYLKFRESYREKVGELATPLLNVHYRDIRDTIVMFVGGIVGSIVGVILLSAFIHPGELHYLIFSLISEIGNPDGLELVLAESVSLFVIVAEHNIIRTLLMLIVGPLFWTAVLWLVAVKEKTKKQKYSSYVALLLIIMAGISSYLWTMMDITNGLITPAIDWFDPNWPWTFAAHLGYRASILYGIIFALYGIVFLVNYLAKGNPGGWWFPPLVSLFALEYFIYDDQFTYIALIILPMILVAFYKVIYGGRPEVKQEDPLITYIRFSLMALAISEVLSTALWVAGIGTIEVITGQNLLSYLISILPHGVVEIPAFLFAAAASIRIARDLAPTITAENWSELPGKTKDLLFDGRTWRTYILVIFFLLIAALIEENVTQLIMMFF
jgi:hypothetical protein